MLTNILQKKLGKSVAGQAFTKEARLNQLREEEDAKLLKRTYVEIAVAEEEDSAKKTKKKYEKCKRCPEIFENEKPETQVSSILFFLY